MLKIDEALTFDDLLLVPAKSCVLPADAEVKTKLTENININIPLVSAAMDTITEHKMAIAMAQAGGIGVIHKNMDIASQAEEVRKVKRFESGMVVSPITVYTDQPLEDVMKIKEELKISGFPVLERGNNKLVGIITNRDVRFAENFKKPVSHYMTSENLVTVKKGITKLEAQKILYKNKIEKLLVVNDKGHCIGLITVKDIERAKTYPNAAKDKNDSLLAAAASGVGEAGMERSIALIEAGVDALVIDTAHGHSEGVLNAVKELRKLNKTIQIIAGNIATPDAALDLVKAGANAVKVGIGPGSICTTRIVAGVGVPQWSAIYEVAQALKKKGIPLVADGGIKNSGDFAKAIAAGANAAMVGSMLAGTDETPGEIFLYQGRSYKAYRGMGSIGAMAKGSADRYFQEGVCDNLKLVPEGIEARVAYKGSVSFVLHQMVGGLKASMGYTGNKNIEEMRQNCNFRRITASGFRESHVHDVTITKEAPNYNKIDL